MGGVQAVHIGVPAADGIGVGDLVAGGVGPLHGQVAMHRLAGHPPHDMDAELQAQLMDLGGDGGKALAVPGGGKTLRGREQPAKLVHVQPGEGHVLRADLPGGGVAPLDVADDVFPAEFLQVLRHIAGVGQKLVLGDGVAEAVPAVPAHGRGEADFIFFHGEGSFRLS